MASIAGAAFPVSAAVRLQPACTATYLEHLHNLFESMMTDLLLPSVLLLTFFSLYNFVSPLPQASSIDGWEADGQDRWSDVCTGEQQFPIDLRAENAEAVNYPKLVFHNYNLKGPVTMENDGYTGTVRGFHTWQYPPSITGGNLNSTYFLRQVNFRWANEHSFNGVDYPAELHLVHISDQYNPGRKEDASGNMAVVAVPVLTGDKELEIEELRSLYEEEDAISPYSGSRHVVLFNPRVLLPWDTTTYYRYKGSLTTPPCAEDGVIWTVMQKPIVVSAEQLNALKNAHLNGEPKIVHKIRNSQPVEGRKLYLNRKVKSHFFMEQRGENEKKFSTDMKFIFVILFILLVIPCALLCFG